MSTSEVINKGRTAAQVLADSRDLLQPALRAAVDSLPASMRSIAGYHFHFLSKDRRHGGHLLDVEAGPLRLKVEALTDFHLALPESEAFLKADLSKNTAEELAYAEQAH